MLRLATGLRTVATRVAVAVLTIAAVSLVVFVGVSLLPGNAAQRALGVQAADPQALQARMHEVGLDRPVLVRYGDWMSGLVRGDLGRSLVSQRPISDELGTAFRNTGVLSAFALLFMVVLGTTFGILAALAHGRPADRVVDVVTLAFMAVPEFVIGTLLVAAFGTGLGVLPAVSLIDSSRPILDQLDLVVLPVATIVIVAVGQVTRMIRAATIDVLQAPHIEMAALRGVGGWRLLLRHVLPNTIGPTIHVLALIVAFLAGGIVVTETVFQYPGVGMAFVTAVSNRDVTTVCAIAVIISAVYVVANLLADLAQMALNPRLRAAAR
ncbi:ABC transporter permease [Conexibacter sp. CPCC 206217]|uniref:ABC transporter permease n=1 Tax=Conexibacter sp. CPCC 206217 TaxID=3064574 RepID=UPI002720ED36|nr:ABC transporter permease [Conexibacter sp. CPCC 206217]MDO8210173.1 ABC transporter permease [Conexibacter sp. CPCC 206217]